MKRILYIFSMVFLLSFLSKAQQLPIFTQYMFNDYILNPAVGGINNYYQVKTTYRQQWAGISDAPVTFMLSTYGPHSKKDMGFGGYIFSDKVGPTSNTGIYLSYAYNFQLFSDVRLSLGVFAGTVLWKYDAASVTLADIADPSNISDSKFRPDASFGALLYTSEWNVGFSANQLLYTRVDLEDSLLNVASRLTSHFYLTGTYRYNINRDIDLEGSGWFKYVYPILPQMDITVRGIYQKLAWFGISWRTSDAIALLIGYNQGLVNIGYSYDITTSRLRAYNTGTHEVVIGVKFSDIKSSRGGRRPIRR